MIQGFLSRNAGVLFPLAIVALLMLMIVPVPVVMLDVLLAFSITLGLVILLVSLYLKEPLEFSGFPSVLLIATLFRLSLNIASTRLILLNGGEGPTAAGHVIATFGNFVVGGNYVVGIIVFIILVIINFVVITKGSGRIAEVGARFTLDAMPGKQMAIDADLNAGLINETVARQRRQRIEREADFYGSMDGASKFVRGDAIAGILITAINIVGGFIIGVVQHDMPAGEAAATYTVLTVGEGLVAQIPALLISTAAGIIVTRAAGSNDLGTELIRQLFASRRVMNLVAGILLVMGLMPGMPLLVFAGVAGVMYLVGRASKGEEAAKPAADSAAPGVPGRALADEGEAGEKDKIENLLPIDLLELEVGFGLIPLVDRNQGGELLDRIQSIRRQFASTMGIIVPPIHIRDNLQLAPGAYSVLVKGVEVARGDLVPDRFLAMNPGEVIGTVPGIETTEPAFGLPALWITREHKDRAEQLGFTVVDGATVVATHLSEILKDNAHELLGRQELQNLLDLQAKHSPKVVEDLVPDKLPLGDVLRVLKNLLREQVSVRDLRTILEGIADYVHLTKNPEILTEFVRQRMARPLSNKLRGPDGKIHVLTLDSTLEDHLRGTIQQLDGDFHLAVDPRLAERLLRGLEDAMGRQATMGHAPVLLVPPELRRPVRNLLERFVPGLVVISHKEVASGVEVTADGEVGKGLATPKAAAAVAGPGSTARDWQASIA